MNIKALSNSELLASIQTIRGTEREIVISILHHLIEIDDRRLYRDAGYSSLFDYCLRALRHSESSACRLVQCARAMRDNPELERHYLEGQVTLKSISLAATSIRQHEIAVEDIVGKTRREVEMLVASPVPAKPREVIKPVKVQQLSEGPVSRPVEERYEIRFSVTKEVFEEFQAIRAALSNELGCDLSVEAVFKKLLAKREARPRKARPARTDTRRIPARVKVAVKQRDHNQCTYVAEDGTRCMQTHYLHFDHIVPFALGGKRKPQT